MVPIPEASNSSADGLGLTSSLAPGILSLFIHPKDFLGFWGFFLDTENQSKPFHFVDLNSSKVMGVNIFGGGL